MVIPAIYIISMPRHMNRKEILVLVLILLLMLSNIASVSILIPSYTLIKQIFSINGASVYLPDAGFMLMTVIFSIFWGYLSDKVNKKIIITIGSIVSIIGFLYSGFTSNFIGLIVARMITGSGMGMVYPIGFAVIADLVPTKERSGWFAFLAIFSSLASGAGSAMAAFSENGWQFPFLILTAITLITVIVLSSVAMPKIGAHDDELARLRSLENANYRYRVSRKDLKSIWTKHTNRNLFWTSFFQIIPGAVFVYVIIMAFADGEMGMFRLLPQEIRIQIGTILSSMVGIGFIIGHAILAKKSDKQAETDKRARAKITFISICFACPFLILLVLQMTPLSSEFVASLNYPSLITTENKLGLVFSTIIAIIGEYPQYLLFILFAYAGSFFSAAPSMFKNAVMVDVNLPEHRGTATSLIQIGENFGKTLVLLLLPEIILLVSDFRWIMLVSILFYLPAIFFWYRIYIHLQKDLDNKEITLSERAQESMLDYFTALDNALDEGIFMVENAKRNILSHPKKSIQDLEIAINIFKEIYRNADAKQATEMAQRAMMYMNNALFFKSELLSITQKNSLPKLNRIFEKINSLWEKSEIGKLEVIYETAFFKCCEARLKSHFNPYETRDILQSASDMYQNVIRQTEDVISVAEAKIQNTSGTQLLKRHILLRKLALNSMQNVNQLKFGIIQLFNKFDALGLKENELRALISLHDEYKLEIPQIAAESLNRIAAHQVKQLIKKIDHLFTRYDRN